MEVLPSPSPGDELASFYSSVGDDDSIEYKTREAAILFSIAEKYLNEEQASEAHRAGIEALSLFRDVDDAKGEVDTLRILLGVLRLKEEVELAARMAQDERDHFHLDGDDYGEASMLLTLSEIHALRRGSSAPMQALESGQQARQLFRKLGNRSMEGNAIIATINAYFQQGKAKEALSAANAALSLFQELDDKNGEARALHGLGLAYSLDDRDSDAMKAATQARDLFHELGIHRLEGNELLSICEYHLKKDRNDDVLDTAREALELFRDLEQPTGETSALGFIVRAHIQMGDADEALSVAEDGLERLRRASFRKGEAVVLGMIVDAYVAQEKLKDALKFAKEALSIMQELGDKESEANQLQTISQLHVDAQQYDQARQTVTEAISLFQELGDEAAVATAMMNVLVNVQIATTSHAEAMQTAEKAQVIYQTLGDKKGMAVATFTLGSICELLKQIDEAIARMKEARASFRALDELALQIQVCRSLANLYLNNNNPEEGVILLGDAVKLCQRERDAAKEAIMLVHTSQAHMAVLSKLVEEETDKSSPTYLKHVELGLKEATAASGLAKKTEDAHLQAATAYQMAEMLLINFRIPEATETVDEAINLFRDCGYPGPGVGESSSHLLKAQILVLQGIRDRAASEASEALALAQQIGDKRGEEMAGTLLDEIQAQMGTASVPVMMQQETTAQEETAVVVEASAAVPAKQLGLDPQEVADVVHGMLASLIGVEMEGDTPFMDAGVDSLLSIEFRSGLTKQFQGLGLSSTLTFDYPTIKALTDHIVEKSKDD